MTETEHSATEPTANDQWERLIEAILFASPDPVPEKAMADRVPEGVSVSDIVASLQARYAGRGAVLTRVESGWAFRTAPDLAGLMNLEREVGRKLSRAAVETLAVIAYHQPATRAEIEEIRGVAVSKGTLDTLLEAGWLRPRGRRRTPGRPMTWGTTPAFLDHFGLEDLKDLPGLGELRAAGLLESGPALAVYADRGEDAAGTLDPEAEILEDAAAEELLPGFDVDTEPGEENVWEDEKSAP
ncbi:MAG: SMC-Scp complex subunit ScpB [Magnetospiraceae bacterium]